MIAAMVILILLTLTNAQADTVLSTDEAFFHTKDKTGMVADASIIARSDIECAMICKNTDTCCRASFEADTRECLLDFSIPCEGRTQSTNGRTTIEKGQFEVCAVPAEVPSSTNTIKGLDIFGKVNVGGYIEYKCNATHFHTAGHLIRTCQVGPSWSGEAPVCKEKQCQLPPDVTGSTPMIDGIVVSGKVNVGVRVVYTCKADFYHTTGDLARMCNSGQVWSGKTPVCKEDCKRSQHGYKYDGIRNTTSSNRQCQRWDADTPHPHDYNNLDAENYCRSPDRSKSSPWCYTLDPSTEYEMCNIPTCTTQAKNCKETPDGVDYFGTIAETEHGNLCQKWSENVPHSHDYDFLSDQENYCRNPFNEEPRPWCYTTDTNIRWEHCNVPSC